MFLSYSSLIVVSLVLLAKQILVRSYEVPEKQYYDIDSSEDLFRNYVSEHQKEYTAEEAEYRHIIFKENLKEINELNNKHEFTVFGLTPFSDLTFDEFKKITSCFRNASGALTQSIEIPNIEAPDHLDWREQNLVTKAKDQKHCGSCYIFGAIAEIEGQHAKVHHELISLSEQYPLDCGSNGCGGGSPDNIMNWLSHTPGALKEKDYPYVGHQAKCSANPNKGVVKVKLGSSSKIKDSKKLKKLLASHGPLAVALYASKEMKHYKGGLLNPTDCGTESADHIVTFIGYGNEHGNHWIIKNSWGSQWGEDGFMRLAMNMNLCDVGRLVALSEVA